MEEPGPVELRRFGLTLAGGVAVIFGLLLPWLFSFEMKVWPWLASIVLIVWALFAASSMAPFYKRWMWLADRVGRFVNAAVLGLVYFLMFIPLGLLMRLYGRDTMHRKWDASAKSYRISSSNPAQRMDRPF